MNDATTKTILVVDDEADVRSYLQAALVEAGFKVVTANDGNEAMQQVEKDPPDLISLDLVMPGKSGARFYRDMIKHKDHSKIPIIIVTGHARDDLGKADLKELTMSGPGIYLEKPVKPDNYVAAIKQLLGLKVTREELNLAEQVQLQNKLKNLIDEADPDTLRKLTEALRKQG